MVYKTFPHEIELWKALEAFKTGNLDETVLRDKVENYIFAEARADFDNMIKGRNGRCGYAERPDHLARKDFFAYALARGGFSREEVRKIPFDNTTPEKYIITHGAKLENLVSKEVTKLICPQPPQPVIVDHNNISHVL